MRPPFMGLLLSSQLWLPGYPYILICKQQVLFSLVQFLFLIKFSQSTKESGCFQYRRDLEQASLFPEWIFLAISSTERLDI